MVFSTIKALQYYWELYSAGPMASLDREMGRKLKSGVFEGT